MAKTVMVDTGFLVALLSRGDRHRDWAVAQVGQLAHPWVTCEAVLSETFFFLDAHERPNLLEMMRRSVVVSRFDLGDELEAVLTLMDKYASVPMSLADACLVRMSETLSDPVVLTTDADFRVYRRHSRQVVPCLMP